MTMQDNQKESVFNLIIVDESGSMGIIQQQAFSGMNETLQTVRQMQQKYPEQEQRVTLVTFNSAHTTWHYDNTPAMSTKDLRKEDYQPNGCTPLYDAMGSAISKVNAMTTDRDHIEGERHDDRQGPRARDGHHRRRGEQFA